MRLDVSAKILKLSVNRKLKIGTYEMVYLLSWFFFGIMYVLNTSLLEIGLIFKVYGVAVSFVLLFLFFKNNKFKITQMIFIAMIFIAMLSGSLIVSKLLYAVYFFFLINSNLTKFNRILKMSIISVAFTTLIVIILCLLGFLPDYVFVRDGGARAHSLGFSYYYNVPAMLLFCSIMYICIRKKIKWKEIAILILFNFASYQICTTRLPLYIFIIFLVLYIMICKFNLFKNLDNKFFRTYSLISFAIVCVFCVYAAQNYDSTNSIMYELNQILNGRLQLSHEAFSKYDIKLFGQYIEMEGNIYGKSQENYFFIDSGYILSVLEYGLMFTIVMIILYSIVGYYSCILNNKVLFIWISTIMIFNIVNGCWSAFVYNPVLFLVLPLLKNRKKISSLRKTKNILVKNIGVKNGQFDIDNYSGL